MTVYPIGIDTSIELPDVVDAVTAVNAVTINKLRDAILAIESELGVHPAGSHTTVRNRLDNLDDVCNALAARLVVTESDIVTIKSDVITLRDNIIEIEVDISSLQARIDVLESIEGSAGIVLGGDLSGSAVSQTVIGIQGNAISSMPPTDGYALIWSQGDNRWEPGKIVSNFDGDLNGDAISQTVVGIQGNAISSMSPTDGYALIWSQGDNHWKPKEIASSSGGGIIYDAYSNRPAAGTSGRLFVPTDGPVKFIDTGSEWRPYVNDRICTNPPSFSSGWTTVDAGSPATSFTDDKGTLLAVATPQGSTSVRRILNMRTAPSTPYTLTVGFYWANASVSGVIGQGIALRDSISGRLLLFYHAHLTAGQGLGLLTIQRFNNSTSYLNDDASVGNYAFELCDYAYFHVHDPGDSGNLIWAVSKDGDYSTASIISNSNSRTNWLTNGPDQVGIIMANNTAAAHGFARMRIFDWTVV